MGTNVTGLTFVQHLGGAPSPRQDVRTVLAAACFCTEAGIPEKSQFDVLWRCS